MCSVLDSFAWSLIPFMSLITEIKIIEIHGAVVKCAFQIGRGMRPSNSQRIERLTMNQAFKTSCPSTNPESYVFHCQI